MFKLIFILTCVTFLLVCSAPSLLAQDEEGLSEQDLMIQHDLSSLRPASAEVANSESPKVAVKLPAEAAASVSGEGKKPAMVLVNGRIVPAAAEASGKAELFQRKELEAKIAQIGQKQKEQAYTVTGQMSRPEPEMKPMQKSSSAL